MRRKVRTLRHWKQRFDKNAEFVWRRPLVYAGRAYRPGDSIPSDLGKNKTKLRRFWESKTIELAQFEDRNVLTGLTASEEMLRQLELMRIRERTATEDFEAADAADAADAEAALVEELHSRAESTEAAKADFEEADGEEFDPDREGDSGHGD